MIVNARRLWLFFALRRHKPVSLVAFVRLYHTFQNHPKPFHFNHLKDSVRSKLKCPLFVASEMSGFGK
jgi:hypothetical protein